MMMAEYKMHEHTQRMFSLVKTVVNKHDPIGLLKMGAPEDEYHPELPGLVNAVSIAKTWKDCRKKIARVFAEWFHESVGAKPEYYTDLAQELWREYAKFFYAWEDEKLVSAKKMSETMHDRLKKKIKEEKNVC